MREYKKLLVVWTCFLVMVSCSQEGVIVTTPPPPPPPSPEEETIHLIQKRVQVLNQTIEYYEDNRDELIIITVERKKAEEELVDAKEAELRAKRLAESSIDRKIELYREELQQKDRQKSINPELVSQEELDKIAANIIDLQEEKRILAVERVDLQEYIENLQKGLAAVKSRDDEVIFDLAMDEKYRQAVALYLKLYQLLIEETQKALIPEEDKRAMVNIYKTKLGELEQRSATIEPITKSIFDGIRIAARKDISINIGFLIGYTFQLEFKVGSYELDILPEQSADFRAIAEALREDRYVMFGFLMFIDGHADSLPFSGGPCRSAARNKELSRQRAVQAKDYFVEKLGVNPDQILLDWYGNLNMQVPARPSGEPENRRIELRITTLEQGEYVSHRDYFTARRSLPWRGKVLAHKDGRWRNAACNDLADVELVPYLGESHAELAEVLGLNEPLIMKRYESGEMPVFIGDDFIIPYNGRCVHVKGCLDRE